MAFRNALSPLGDYIAKVIAGAGAIANAIGSFKMFGQTIANLLPQAFGATGVGQVLNAFASKAPSGTANQIPLAAQIQQANMQSQIAQLQGYDEKALLAKQLAEQLKLKKDSTDQELKLYQGLLDKKQQLERENLRLTELNLKRQETIYKDFTKNVSTALQSGLSESIFQALEGNKQDLQTIIKHFTTPINRAISDAISQSFFSAVLGGQGLSFKGFADNFKNILSGKSATTTAIETSANRSEIKMDTINKTLMVIQQCICQTAANTAALLGKSGSGGGVNIPTGGGGSKNSWLGPLLSIAGMAAGFAIGGPPGAMVGGSVGGAAGGAFGGGGDLPAGAGITGNSPFGGFSPSIGHSGGFVGAFATGGEVPALVQPGEFIVNRSASARNRDLLQDVNSGSSKKVRGTTNVFMIRANDAASFVAHLSTPDAQRQMESNLMKVIMNNGDIRKVIQNFAK